MRLAPCLLEADFHQPYKPIGSTRVMINLSSEFERHHEPEISPEDSRMVRASHLVQLHLPISPVRRYMSTPFRLSTEGLPGFLPLKTKTSCI
jgi:hypothetical protein